MHANQGSTTSTSKYIPGAEIRKRFRVSNGTLQRWANEGRVDSVRLKSINVKRLYKEDDLDNVIAGFKVLAEKELGCQRARVCYARVSSAKQKEDLHRQIDLLHEKYPDHEIVKDIGSGINWKRTGFTSLLDRVMHGDIEEVVVSHKDRLCRFAFDLVKHVFENAGCKLVVHDETARGKDGIAELESAETELRDDLLAIVTVFVASNNGRRAAAHRRERKEKAARDEKEENTKEAPEEDAEDDGGTIKEKVGSGKVHEIQDLPGCNPEGNAEAVDGCNEMDLQQDGRETQHEEAGDEGVSDTTAGMGWNRGQDMDETIGRWRRSASQICECPIRDSGLTDKGHSRRLHFAQKQRKGTKAQIQVPPEKRRRNIHYSPAPTTQLQDQTRECVAIPVRDGAQ
jgi:putative resolvase